MKYAVEYTARAERDLYAAFAYIARNSPFNALRWLEDFETAVAALSDFPGRCPRASESDLLGIELRQLFQGSFRVLFVVQGRRVRILHIRHASRRAIEEGEL